MQIMKCEDLYALQTLCVKLFAQTKAQQSVYESMLRDMGKLPPQSGTHSGTATVRTRAMMTGTHRPLLESVNGSRALAVWTRP